MPRDLGRRAQAPAFEQAAHVRMLGTVVGQQPQEAELRAIFVVRRNKSTFALPPDHEVFGGQLVDRLADGALADLVAGRGSTSLGMISPGFHSPVSRLCVINDLICWYNGLNVGDGAAAGEGADRSRPAALGRLRRSDSRYSPGSMSWRAFHHKPHF